MLAFTKREVRNTILATKPNKALGPDHLPNRVLYLAAN